jgi:hypothetical protein
MRFVHHAGLVLIRADLDRATVGLEPDPHRDRVRQWVAGVLCGAVNIEQTGQLSFEALSLLIGPCLRSDYRQRTCLHEISTSEAALAVWRMVAYREANITIITWEKGGGHVDWVPGSDRAVAGFGITRYGNNSSDTITYSVEYYSRGRTGGPGRPPSRLA